MYGHYGVPAIFTHFRRFDSVHQVLSPNLILSEISVRHVVIRFSLVSGYVYPVCLDCNTVFNAVVISDHTCLSVMRLHFDHFD